MATVYTAIAAFENMVRQFVVKILMENKGENWWTECVSDKIRKSADSRKAEEDKIKWHTHRGTSMINYVDFADLANIMGQNYDLFEVHIVSLEWAKQIFCCPSSINKFRIKDAVNMGLRKGYMRDNKIKSLMP